MDHNKKYSSQQEKRLAKNLGGDLQPASGALPIASKKGDVKVTSSDNWKLLIDGKTTKAKTHQSGVLQKSIKKEDLLKVAKQAQEGGYDMGVLAISFDNKTDYYVIKDRDFECMHLALCQYEQIIQELRSNMNKITEGK